MSNNAKVSTKGMCASPLLSGYSTAFKYLWRVYVQGCMRTGREWTVTPEEFLKLISSACHYCGSAPLNMTKLKESENIPYNGIDRVDNGVGYLAGNLVPCCKHCNSMKSHWPKDAFLEHVRRIAAHQSRAN